MSNQILNFVNISLEDMTCIMREIVASELQKAKEFISPTPKDDLDKICRGEKVWYKLCETCLQEIDKNCEKLVDEKKCEIKIDDKIVVTSDINICKNLVFGNTTMNDSEWKIKNTRIQYENCNFRRLFK